MKKQLLKALTLIFAIALVFALPMSAEEYLTGDMNGDGVVNTDDAIYLLRHVLAPSKYPLVCNHNLTEHEAKEATCTETGYKAYQTCSRCDYTTYEEIPAHGHTEIVTAGIPATCADEGKTDHIECITCGVVLQESIKITKRQHNIIDIPAVESTCSSIGRTASQMCGDCGQYIVYPLYFSKKAHTFDDDQDAVCNGYYDPYTGITYECSYTRKTDVSLCKHLNEEIIVNNIPTCSQFGITRGKICADCGEIMISQSVIGKDVNTSLNKFEQEEKKPID